MSRPILANAGLKQRASGSSQNGTYPALNNIQNPPLYEVSGHLPLTMCCCFNIKAVVYLTAG